MSTVKINIATLTKQVEEGMKKPALATLYGLSQVQMGKALKDAGLKIRKFHAPAFELVSDDTTDSVIDSAEPANLDAPVEEEEVATELEETVIEETATEDSAEESTTEEVTWTT